MGLKTSEHQSTKLVAFSCVRVTPFGTPVEPLVNRMYATSAAVTWGPDGKGGGGEGVGPRKGGLVGRLFGPLAHDDHDGRAITSLEHAEVVGIHDRPLDGGVWSRWSDCVRVAPRSRPARRRRPLSSRR